MSFDSILELHATGKSIFVDDIAEPPGMLFAYIGLSEFAHAEIQLDLDRIRHAPGVEAVLTALDVPGSLDISPLKNGLASDLIFARDVVTYAGQPMFAVLARTYGEAESAASLARIEYKCLEEVFDVDVALARETYVDTPRSLTRGDVDVAMGASEHRIDGSFRIGGQEHFYMECQISICLPTEGSGIRILSSTQHVAGIQEMVSRALALPRNRIVVETVRIGGGFGGKETQAAPFACVGALGVYVTGRPVKVRLERSTDMRATGKRHDFRISYKCGFKRTGEITALDVMLASRCGATVDLSPAVNDRTLLDLDNCYYFPAIRITSHRCRTNTVSNTAFRGFGTAQGVLAIESILDAVSRFLKCDSLELRKKNIYQPRRGEETPYGMKVDGRFIGYLLDRLQREADLSSRRALVQSFNETSTDSKKGLVVVPVKYGIAFGAKFLNQASATVLLHTDGSAEICHGGIEMGQGLSRKLASVAARELGIDTANVTVRATATDRIPNASATAASTGTDLNGKAVQMAARTIRDRLIGFASKRFSIQRHCSTLKNGYLTWDGGRIPLVKVVELAYLSRVPLLAVGHYQTPKLDFDKSRYQGRPYYYFTYGVAASEVTIDTTTGDIVLDRVDILQDVGQSLDHSIDISQIEGAFVQGAGWLTTEELLWDPRGRLATISPSTYKIPTISFAPPIFNVTMCESSPADEERLYGSKAVGEPPLPLATSVFLAIKDAIASAAGYTGSFDMDAPATPERIITTLAWLKDGGHTGARSEGKCDER